MIAVRKFISLDEADRLGFYGLLELFELFPELNDSYIVINDDKFYNYKGHLMLIIDHHFDDDFKLDEEEARKKLPHLFI